MRPESSTRRVRLLSSGQPMRWLGVPLYRIAALIILTLLVSGTVYMARAATQACKDIDNVTICFDHAEDITTLFNPPKPAFRYEGNVTIGLKGQAALLKLTPSAFGSGAASIIQVLDGSGFSNIKFPLSIAGGLQFINEPTARPC